LKAATYAVTSLLVSPQSSDDTLLLEASHLAFDVAQCDSLHT
jgi:hypothetical protein